MPHVMDRGKQGRKTHEGNAFAVECEFETTVEFGKEIDAMDDTVKKSAVTDLLPELDALCVEAADYQAKTLERLRAFNDKTRQWIDEKRGLT